MKSVALVPNKQQPTPSLLSVSVQFGRDLDCYKRSSATLFVTQVQVIGYGPGQPLCRRYAAHLQCHYIPTAAEGEGDGAEAYTCDIIEPRIHDYRV